MCHFSIDEWTFVNKYKHSVGIKKIFSELYGMSVVFVDNNSEGHIYSPINNTIVKIENMSPNTLGIIWETYELEKVI